MISRYFNHVSSKNEQALMTALTAETIFQRGLDLFYIPREESDGGFDYLFGEDPENKFGKAVQIEMMCLQIAEGFDGADAIGRFALDIGDTATFIVERFRFAEEVTRRYNHITRPREGDLIVFVADPTEHKTIFEITFVDPDVPFYQFGRSNRYQMEAEMFNYSHEDMNTGVDYVDEENDTSDEYTEADPIQKESDTFMDFDEKDPFSEGKY